MKNVILKTISAVLLLALLLPMLFACNGGKDETEPTAALTEATDPDEEGINLDARYQVVYPSNASQLFLKISSAMYRYLKSKCSVSEHRTDFIREGNEAPKYEILIGNTRRTESNFEVEDGYDYTIKAVGKKLAIVATKVEYLDDACYYLKELIEKEGAHFDDDYSYSGKSDKAEKLIMIGDQKGGNIDIYDIGSGEIGERILRINTSRNPISGMKVRNTEKYGRVILYCTEDIAEIISYDTKKTIERVYTASNAHSVELTPDGRIFAAAASTGGEIRFYNTDDLDAGYTAIELYDAHGVLYDDTRNCFYVVGDSTLAAYTAKAGAGGRVEVSLVKDSTCTIPTPYAHDLMPYAGDADKLWVTTGDAAYIFDKNTKEFKTEYLISDIKGIGSFRDGTVCYITPDKQYQTWTSNSFNVSYKLKITGDIFSVTLYLPENSHAYKIRPFVEEYTY